MRDSGMPYCSDWASLVATWRVQFPGVALMKWCVEVLEVEVEAAGCHKRDAQAGFPDNSHAAFAMKMMVQGR